MDTDNRRLQSVALISGSVWRYGLRSRVGWAPRSQASGWRPVVALLHQVGRFRLAFRVWVGCLSSEGCPVVALFHHFGRLYALLFSYCVVYPPCPPLPSLAPARFPQHTDEQDLITAHVMACMCERVRLTFSRRTKCQNSQVERDERFSIGTSFHRQRVMGLSCVVSSSLGLLPFLSILTYDMFFVLSHCRACVRALLGVDRDFARSP